MQKIQIGNLQEEDIPAIAKMEKDIFADPWTEHGIRETFSQKNAWILGAWKEHCIVGYVIMYSVLDEGEIARIAVEPGYRRQGVAGSMLRELQKQCEEQGIVRILLDVRAGNAAAIACYRKYGFEKDGIRRGYYTNPREDALLMSVKLGKSGQMTV